MDNGSDHWGWLVSSTGLLHYVPNVTHESWRTWYDDGRRGDHLVSTRCRRRIRVTLPGMFDRLGAPRCSACCRLVSIATGNGTPRNELAAK